ncbi:MAG TPA: glycosyltransferase family 4 protein, partial [Candidatus Binataceae bacterium]|nr:glycosyltransferase family 4 protein [Candidatus Binataceae bacterium]
MCEDLSLEHEVTFVAGPSYFVPDRPRRLWTRQRLGRVSIIRTWGTRLPKHRLPLRIVNLGTYYALAGLAAACDRRPDIVIAETDPPLLGLLAAILKRRWGCRFVYNVRDLYPDIARATGGVKNRGLLDLLERANRIAYKSADRIVALGEDMRRRLIAKGVPPERLEVVPDWVDCEQIRPLEINPFRSQFGNKFVVMYSGNLGLSQQLESVLGVAARMKGVANIVFVLIGDDIRTDEGRCEYRLCPDRR